MILLLHPIIEGFFSSIWDLICKLWWLLWHNPLAFFGVVAFCWLIYTMTKGRSCKLPWQ